MIVQFHKSPLVLGKLCARWNLINLPLKWGNFTVLSCLVNKRRRHIRIEQLSHKLASRSCSRFCWRIYCTRCSPSGKGLWSKHNDQLWELSCPPGWIIQRNSKTMIRLKRFAGVRIVMQCLSAEKRNESPTSFPGSSGNEVDESPSPVCSRDVTFRALQSAPAIF